MTRLHPSNRPLPLCERHLSITPHLSQPAADLFGLPLLFSSFYSPHVAPAMFAPWLDSLFGAAA